MASRQVRKTGSRGALSQAPELPWSAEDEAVNVLADLPIILGEASSPVGLSSARLPLPDFDEEPSFTPSLRAPRDLPLPEPKPRDRAPKKGAQISDFVRSTFAERLYGPVRYRLRIGDPASSSASSKRRVREPLLLVPSQELEPSILCGWLDVSKKEAQIRSYGIMALRHESHHGEPPSISEAEYSRFLDKLMDTLFDGGIRLVFLVPDTQDFEPTQFNPVPAEVAPAASPVQPAPRSRRSVFGVLLLVALAFALGMSAEHLLSGGSQALSWLAQVPGRIQHAALSHH
jgi:hypothetical protein